MRDLSKVNKVDVALTLDRLDAADRAIDTVKDFLYCVELNETADFDCGFLSCVTEWLRTKQKYLLEMFDMTEDDTYELLNKTE